MLIAAAACEMHPAAVIKGAELRGDARGAARPTRSGRAADGVTARAGDRGCDGAPCSTGERAVPA